ncbi:MAG TPA: hypothetical protein VEF04_20275, partial [Blastocatellia bacterium]|nr:hypothetical protein [Blastocatellia bacterium]
MKTAVALERRFKIIKRLNMRSHYAALSNSPVSTVKSVILLFAKQKDTTDETPGNYNQSDQTILKLSSRSFPASSDEVEIERISNTNHHCSRFQASLINRLIIERPTTNRMQVRLNILSRAATRRLSTHAQGTTNVAVHRLKSNEAVAVL